jgi:hypothetical protein
VSWKRRFGVFLAFTAAAMVLAARIVQTEQADRLDLKGSWASYLVLTAIALAVVAGAAFVPALRLVRGTEPGRRALEGVKAIGLLAAGVGAAALAAWIWGDRAWTQLLAGPGADPPPDLILTIVIGLVVGVPIALVPAILRGWLDALIVKGWAGWPTLALFVIAAGLAGGSAVGPLWTAWDSGEDWKQVAAACAVPAAPIVAFLCLGLWPKRVKRPTA